MVGNKNQVHIDHGLDGWGFTYGVEYGVHSLGFGAFPRWSSSSALSARHIRLRAEMLVQR